MSQNDLIILIISLAIPFLGTTLGSAMVFFLKKDLSPRLQKILLGFASGVMVAASIWSLIIPSIQMSEEDYGKLRFIPAVVGFLVGILFLLGIDSLVPHLHLNSDEPEGIKTRKVSKTSMMMFAVSIHNLPEGMAVGVVLAGALYGNATISMMGAFSLALGIAIQNFPEGAIISMPLYMEGKSKAKSFWLGTLSGAIEPLGAGLMILLTHVMTPILPYILSFAAGAMFYVVVEELIPEAQNGKHSNLATVGFAVGFALMMVLDIALG
ncbi:MAG: ZIP family metal transporter [Bacilli bacterium]|nr:ZIP family metal transporter [Bacilli bacterium]